MEALRRIWVAVWLFPMMVLAQTQAGGGSATGNTAGSNPNTGVGMNNGAGTAGGGGWSWWWIVVIAIVIIALIWWGGSRQRRGPPATRMP